MTAAAVKRAGGNAKPGRGEAPQEQARTILAASLAIGRNPILARWFHNNSYANRSPVFNSKMGFLRGAETIGLPCFVASPDRRRSTLQGPTIAVASSTPTRSRRSPVAFTPCTTETSSTPHAAESVCIENASTSRRSLLGLHLGIKEVDEGIWIVSFMSYDLGFIDLEQKTLQPLDNPFGPRLSPMSWVRSVTYLSGPDTDRTRVGMVGVAGFEPTTPSPPD